MASHLIIGVMINHLCLSPQEPYITVLLGTTTMNPSITAECGNLKEDFSYCVKYKKASIPVSYSTTKFTTAPRSFTALVPSKTIPTKPSTTTVGGNGVETPDPIQPDMVSNCNKFYFVELGDNCNAVSSKHGITLAQFTTWNPKRSTGHTATPTQSTKPTNGIETPSPIQAGMTKICNKFHLIKSTTTCNSIQDYYKLRLKDFYSWNPAVGTNCQSLLVDYWVCVSVVGWTPPTPTTPNNGITTPTSIQSGMTKNCNKFHIVKSTTTYYNVCVRVIGQKPSPTSTGNGITTPTPIQAGMTKSCNKFHTVKSTTTCTSIQDYYKISFADFFAWNPAIGCKCTALWADYNACVGVVKSTTTRASIQNYYKITMANLFKWNPAIGSTCKSLWVDYWVCVQA
ncbi:uncharacterized protein BKA55DRAFT_664171 [Fusarium redolens]|uniref:LysM domain-containing protein n=1 Tax=Fusarium redolens TaxID=48865 RepID=A0A9P9H052_FUSRE|nr:uncharacterized protein BKA55DRAFT_664171 [Fusarium redolens]KAH7248620.1 hypothetical protein BKA55DRAFT_664171 [Fusarium redolens]